MKKNKTNNLGKICTLKSLELIKSREPLDYLKFIVCDENEKYVFIADKADRLFKVNKNKVIFFKY